MRPEIAKFWEDLRQELRRDYGQESGRRNREKVRLREQLARDLQLSSRTLKGFLNGNQASLGSTALFAVFARRPDLGMRYIEAMGQQSSADTVGVPGGGVYIQLTLQFDGSDDSSKSFTARIPEGRQGVLTVKIDPRRVA